MKIMKTLTNQDQIDDLINNNFITVIVFATRTCNVCKPLKQKLSQVLKKHDKVALGEIYIDEVVESKGRFQVFTVPITLVFVDGKESKRYSAAMNIIEVEQIINRYENLLYE